MNWEDRIAEREATEFIAAAPRSERGESAIDFCRRVLSTGAASVWTGDGGETLLDTFSASAVVAVYDAMSEAQRAKLASAPLARQVTVCMKLCK